MLNFLYDIRDFLSSPLKLTIVLSCIALALISFYLLKKKDLSMKKKLVFMYSHVFFLIFPVVFFLFQKTCEMIYLNCDAPRYIAYILTFVGITGLISGFILAPIMFYKIYRKNSKELKKADIISFVKAHAKKLGIKTPKVYLLNKAKPMAFSMLKSRIFVSVGLFDLLNKKEIESVLLHELGHLKSNSSMIKFSTLFTKFLSPLANFTPITDLKKEEIKADKVAIRFQKTSKHLNSAKKKVNEFYRFMV